jgi:hypothetical protein
MNAPDNSKVIEDRESRGKINLMLDARPSTNFLPFQSLVRPRHDC